MRKKRLTVCLILICLFLTSCNKTDTTNRTDIKISTHSLVDLSENSSVEYRNKLYRADGTYQDFEDTYNAIAIKVNPGEKYIINGFALNEQFPFVLCVNESNPSDWNRDVNCFYGDDLKGNVYGYIVEVPENTNNMIINTKRDISTEVYLVNDNIGLAVQNFEKNKTAENVKLDFDKAYFAFVLDDANSYTYSIYQEFHKNGIPLSCAVIIDNLNDDVTGFDGKIKDVLDLVVNDGGEILAHYAGNLADIGYSRDGIDYEHISSAWNTKVVMPKAVLECLGYDVNGIMRADYTQPNSSTGELYCSYLYDYSDNMGISGEYNLRRTYIHDFKTLDEFVEWIDKAKQNPGFYPIAFHGWEDILKEDGALEKILDSILAGNNCEITTYKNVCDMFK